MGIPQQIKLLEEKRERLTKKIDAELSRLRTSCKHPQPRRKGYPARPGDPSYECLDCGAWF